MGWEREGCWGGRLPRAVSKGAMLGNGVCERCTPHGGAACCTFQSAKHAVPEHPPTHPSAPAHAMATKPRHCTHCLFKHTAPTCVGAAGHCPVAHHLPHPAGVEGRQDEANVTPGAPAQDVGAGEVQGIR